ncbi:Fe Mn superoxide [Babesia ovata]|uniref:Fe Mn superoxide n=1 Tax=Babesia ovata TaxID=189622 RepID=A0A2H6KI11_9APIC|nr:Fe Mn superoxide [Babesia ovata]GBE62623.1 Fe Mn superoxide [Babesia ovata]
MSAVLRISKRKVSVVIKTILSTDAFLEIDTAELFHSPYILEGREDDTIALNVSVSSLYETLNAAVNSEYAALKLKRYTIRHLVVAYLERRNNQVASLSVTFPDPAFPSICITLDILITPAEEYVQSESVIPEIPPCSCNIGLTKFQSIICYLESANRIGNELTEFEVCRINNRNTSQRTDFGRTQDLQLLDNTNQRGVKTNANSDTAYLGAGTKTSGAATNRQSETKDAEGEVDQSHSPILLKLRSRKRHYAATYMIVLAGILAELETAFYGLHSFSSHVGEESREYANRNPKTVLKTDAVYTICKNAIDSIIFSKHEALLVAAIPDDYVSAEWTYFIFSVIALDSCQMIFKLPNQVSETQ